MHPKDLVQKYGEYIHGDLSSEDRRIVKDVIVFNGKDLLERFFSYVADASKQVRGTNRPIFVLVFCHSRQNTYAIVIRGTGEHRTCPGLTTDKFNEALRRHNPNPNVAMLTTPCFCGGWVHTSFLNMTAVAGVNTEDEILSWPESVLLSRCCGSRYAIGVAAALIKTGL